MDEKVKIRRQWNNWQIAAIPFSKIGRLKWDRVSGGVQSISPQPFIHGYVSCDEIEGEIAHSGIHGPCPHLIKVVVIKKDNTPAIWKKILERVGPKPTK